MTRYLTPLGTFELPEVAPIRHVPCRACHHSNYAHDRDGARACRQPIEDGFDTCECGGFRRPLTPEDWAVEVIR